MKTKTLEEVKKLCSKEVTVENDRIMECSVVITGHFGNCVSLSLVTDNRYSIPLYNSTENIGYILRDLVMLLDKDMDSSVDVQDLKSTPIRIVYEGETYFCSSAVAIGNFMNDKFVMIEELMHHNDLEFECR